MRTSYIQYNFFIFVYIVCEIMLKTIFDPNSRTGWTWTPQNWAGRHHRSQHLWSIRPPRDKKLFTLVQLDKLQKILLASVIPNLSLISLQAFFASWSQGNENGFVVLILSISCAADKYILGRMSSAFVLVIRGCRNQSDFQTGFYQTSILLLQ